MATETTAVHARSAHHTSIAVEQECNIHRRMYLFCVSSTGLVEETGCWLGLAHDTLARVDDTLQTISCGGDKQLLFG